MATITVTYLLDETGRRASLLAGGEGKRDQHVDVPATSELLALASVHDDGCATYDLSPSFTPGGWCLTPAVYTAPLTPERAAELIPIVAATLEQHRAEREAAKLAEQAVRRAEYEATAAKRAELTAQWRALAARYLAGEELEVNTTPTTTIAGVRSGETSVTQAEWMAVDAEHERRETAQRAAEKQARAAALAAVQAARVAWLREHEAPQHAIERCEAGVLPDGEMRDLVRDKLLPVSVSDVVEYELHNKGDVDHNETCDEYFEIKWEVTAGDDHDMTEEEWTSLQLLRAHYAATPAAVDVRVHTAHLDCGCNPVEWLVARVTLALPELDLTVRRQYAL